MIGVPQAHAALAIIHGEDEKPGAGVTIGVIDSGIHLDHSEFDGASITRILPSGIPEETQITLKLDEFSHGTRTTSVMAAQPNGEHFVGVAWGADFKVFAAPITAPITRNIDPIYDRSVYDWVATYQSVLADNVDIDLVNASYAISGTFVENWEANALRGLLSYDRLAVIAQSSRDATDRTIFVWAAGNDNGLSCQLGNRNCECDLLTGCRFNATSPNLYGGAVARLEELQGHNIVVVALDNNGQIASHSNRCGVAGNWCIAAPGSLVTTANFGYYPRKTIPVSGTSYAVPFVVGGLALMKQFFRNQMSNPELVTRLFETADKEGGYAAMNIYGQGLMDLSVAVSPVGDLTVTKGHTVSDTGYSLRTTWLHLGNALGDGLPRALTGLEIMALDKLGGPFFYDLSSFAGTANSSSFMTRLRSLMAPRIGPDRSTAHMKLNQHGIAVERSRWRLGLLEIPGNSENSVLNLAENAATFTVKGQNGLNATAFATVDHAQQHGSKLGALLAWRRLDKPFGARLGWLVEQETALGSVARGAFGRLSSNSVVVGLMANTEYHGWRISVDTEIGSITPHVRGGIISDVSRMTTSAFSIQASRPLTDIDEITYYVSQPPRVEHGTATLTFPVGRTKERAVLRESASINLSPTGRQIDLAVRWRRKYVLGNGELLAEALFSHDPGHVDTKPEIGLLLGLRNSF